MLALTYLGGEAAQIALGVSDKVARVFQGMLLFFVLACDTLILYRIRSCAAPPQLRQREPRMISGMEIRHPHHHHRRDAAAASRRSANWWSSAPACSISASRA